MKKYSLQFLDDEAFERLPASDIYNKVGVAYPERGEAYVRRSGMALADVFTAAHELEHLEGKSHGENYDKENKCYYKDAGQWIQTIGSIAAPFTGPAAPFVAAGANAAGGTMHNNNVQKSQNSQMLDQQRQSEEGQGMFDPMSQFQSPGMNPSAGSTAPNVVQSPGGIGSGGGVGGAIGNSPVGGNVMQLIRNQNGNYSGRQ